jgi:hypothetical protein
MAMRPCNLLKVAPPKTAISSCGFLGSKGLHIDSRLKNPNSARQTEPLTNKFALLAFCRIPLGQTPGYGLHC